MKHRAQSVLVARAVLVLAMLLVVGCQRAKPPRTVFAPEHRTPALARLEAAQGPVEEMPTTSSPIAEELEEPTLAPTAQPEEISEEAPTATPGPPLETEEVQYVVKVGDTLLDIAIRFDTTTEALMTRNNLADPDRLSVGQALWIPTTVTVSSGAGSTIRHTVEASDSLVSIALAYRTTVLEILRANSFGLNSQGLEEGTVIQVPVDTHPSVRTHTVNAGENLGEIAQEYGVTAQDVVNASGLLDPDRLDVGQVLLIP